MLEKNPNSQQPPTPLSIHTDDTSHSVIKTTVNTLQTPEYTKLYAHCCERYQELEELLEFAVERGKLEPLSLATEIKNLKKTLYYSPDSAMTGEQLSQTEAALEILYTKIIRLVSPVTIETLRATSSKYAIHRPWWSSWLLGSFSVGRNFLRQLFWVGLILLLIMFVGKHFRVNMSEGAKTKDFLIFGSPFLYGAIGAWIYLYRTLTRNYSERCLNPQEWPNYWLRLFMGSLAGGLLVHFFMPGANEVPLDNTQSDIMAKATLGLLAGYSVDFFYGMLDRLIQAALPPDKKEGDTVVTTAKQVEIDTLLKRLHETDNEQDKAVIRRMFERL